LSHAAVNKSKARRCWRSSSRKPASRFLFQEAKKQMLRCARKQHAQWEKVLAKFRLANYQLKNAGIQQLGTNAGGAFPHAHDPALRGNWYNQPGVRQRYAYAELTGFGLVPAHRNLRQTPEWAFNDRQCRALLLRLYPRLLVKRNPKDARDMRAGQGLRKMAAVTALVLYRAYRQLLSDKAIAEELGVSRSAVSNRLDKLNRTAKELFGKQTAGRVNGGRPCLRKA
jgi:hypothetical protein